MLESLQAYPGVSVQSLLDAHPGLPVDVIWALLIKQLTLYRISRLLSSRVGIRSFCIAVPAEVP